MPHPFFAAPAPVVIGHRGAAGDAPENTLVSFERAVAAGADVLESDVHATRDGVVVVFHDDTLERTTDGRGRVADLTLAELERIDAGYAFTPDSGRSFPYRAQGHRIPTLEAAFRAFPDAYFNLELKELQPELVSGTVALVERYDRADRTLLTAGHDPVMAALRAELARSGTPVATGACAGEVAAFVHAAKSGGAPPRGVMALQVPAFFGGRPVVTEALLHAAHTHDIAVHVWTVNDVESMHALLDAGVDGIVSDYPARLREVIARRRGAA